MTRTCACLAVVLLAALPLAARAQSYVHYECERGTHFDLTLLPQDKAAFVQVDGKSLRLPKSVSITGTRYRGSGITVWINGQRATLRRAGKRIECKEQ